VLGRFLEVVGMSAVLVGLILGMNRAEWVRLELMYLGAGLIVFYVGYVLERPQRR
jgi:hypothetical protein